MDTADKERNDAIALATDTRAERGSSLEVLFAFLKLGVTCFGGPIAHIGYFREEFVVRRKWIGEHAYADLVGLCQFLPGPASSQVAFSIGLMRAGYRGALAAWAGFTLPSAIVLVLFAYGAGALSGPAGIGLLHGLNSPYRILTPVYFSFGPMNISLPKPNLGRRLGSAIQAGGRPRRFRDRAAARRSSTIIASPICSRSWRRSETIFDMSMTEDNATGL